jgi:hypothetical protein
MLTDNKVQEAEITGWEIEVANNAVKSFQRCGGDFVCECG